MRGELIGREWSDRNLDSLSVPGARNEERNETISNCDSGSGSGSEDEQIQHLAEVVGRMEVLNPEVLRVVPAWRALEGRGEAFRTPGLDLYSKSQKSEEIPVFWSHSWHDGPWKKILTLMVFYNGTAAVILGSLVAIPMMFLFAFSILPGWYGVHAGFSGAAWGLLSGVVLACAIMMIWRPQTRVFFDSICITKRDAKLKAQSVTSLGGILRHSQSMLVLWDPTWTERLWCLFELGAFLKSTEHKQSKRNLIIRPVFMGPVSVAVFLTVTAAAIPLTMIDVKMDREATDYIPVAAAVLVCSIVAGYICMSFVREYFRNLDTMKQQLLSLSFDTARCSCCDRGHVDQWGNEILCDRKVLRECMTGWFGSQAGFEEILRSQVLAVLDHDLDERVFSTKWLLGVTIPLWWAFMDFAARLYALDPDNAVGLVPCGTAIWLAFPTTLSSTIVLGKWMREKPEDRLLDILKNLLPLCAPAVCLLFSTCCFMLTNFLLPASFTDMARAGVFVSCITAYSVFIRCIMTCLKAVLQAR